MVVAVVVVVYACKGLYSHPLLLSPPSPFSFCSEFSTGTFGCRYAKTAAGCQTSTYASWNKEHCGSGGTGCKFTTFSVASLKAALVASQAETKAANTALAAAKAALAAKASAPVEAVEAKVSPAPPVYIYGP